MRPIILTLTAVLMLTGCDGTITIGEPPRCPNGECPAVPESQCPYKSVPPMDLPVELRERNYGGSCVHASMVSILRWQHLFTLADWWRATFSGGEGLGGLVAKCEKIDLEFAYTGEGDPAFLEWCSRTKRGAVIFYYKNHSISFCGFVGSDAVVMDNNRTDKLIRIPKAEFIQRWKSYGGVALTPVYDPAPPKPWW